MHNLPHTQSAYYPQIINALPSPCYLLSKHVDYKPALGLFKAENAAQFYFFVTNQKMLSYIYLWMRDGRGGGGGGRRNDFIYDCQCNKNIETHTICQTDKKEYSSKVKSARQTFLSLPMNIVKDYCAINCLFYPLCLFYPATLKP